MNVTGKLIIHDRVYTTFCSTLTVYLIPFSSHKQLFVEKYFNLPHLHLAPPLGLPHLNFTSIFGI